MRAVIQRVSQAKVVVDENTVGQIGKGFMILLGVHEQDTQADVDYLVGKISKLRVFEDEQQKMNRSIIDVGGEILSISQFTLFADTKKGNRPSFVQAAKPDTAIPLYEAFNEGLRQVGIPVETGIFGADMKCHLLNDGPVTIITKSTYKKVRKQRVHKNGSAPTFFLCGSLPFLLYLFILAVDDDRYGAIVDEVAFHIGTENARFNRNSCLTQSFIKSLI